MPETVLLVDDTGLLQEIIRENLHELGYAVLVASSGDEALRIAGEQRGSIHLLLTDIMMPRMRGTELAARLAVTHPEIRVVFMTGSGPAAMADPEVLKAGGDVLEKPFTQDQLAKALRDVLDR